MDNTPVIPFAPFTLSSVKSIITRYVVPHLPFRVHFLPVSRNLFSHVDVRTWHINIASAQLL